MAQRVHRAELETGRWYVVQQGSVLRPMQLVAWSSSNTAIMLTRQGDERQVSILRIVEGWDPAKQQRQLVRKSGEPAFPELDKLTAAARRHDPDTSRAAARKASRGCGRVAWLVLGVLVDGEPRTDEQIAQELPGSVSDSSVRGRRSDLVRLGYVQVIDSEGETRGGNKSRRWSATWAGSQALQAHNRTREVSI